MKLKEVLEEEKGKIKLPYKDVLKLSNLAREVISLLEKRGVKAYVGGSLAKGTTVLKEGKQDVDIFALFKDEKGADSLGRVLEKMNFLGKLGKVHGSRDYYQIDTKEAILEIVPVVERKDFSLVENVTDFSLNHVGYIRSEIEKNPNIVDEIRLAKVFCSAQRVYGAESYIRGFSGYSLEVLVIHFGGFVKFLRGVDRRRVIDPKKHFRSEREALREINGSKLGSPIVLVDPTYKLRNATAGLGVESFERFLRAAKAFLKSPSLDYFEYKKFDIKKLKDYALKKGARFVEVELKTNRQEGDVAGTKMKKFFDFFVSELKRKKQKVLKKEFDYLGKGSVASGYLVVEEEKEIEIKGPSKKISLDVIRSFKEAKGKRAFERRGYWWSRETTSIEEIFESVKHVEKEMGAEGKILV